MTLGTVQVNNEKELISTFNHFPFVVGKQKMNQNLIDSTWNPGSREKIEIR